jgi:hypothetical protein
MNLHNQGVSVSVSAAPYADFDDSLAAAESDYKTRRPELSGWNLWPKWANADRSEILLEIPAHVFYSELSDDFERWCESRGRAPIPADEMLLAHELTGDPADELTSDERVWLADFVRRWENLD